MLPARPFRARVHSSRAPASARFLLYPRASQSEPALRVAAPRVPEHLRRPAAAGAVSPARAEYLNLPRGAPHEFTSGRMRCLSGLIRETHAARAVVLDTTHTRRVTSYRPVRRPRPPVCAFFFPKRLALSLAASSSSSQPRRAQFRAARFEVKKLPTESSPEAGNPKRLKAAESPFQGSDVYYLSSARNEKYLKDSN